MKQQLEQLLLTAVSGLVGSILSEAPEPSAIAVERTRDPKHGDFATNIALRLAKPARRNPRELAQAIITALPANSMVDRTEVAGGGMRLHAPTGCCRQWASRAPAIAIRRSCPVACSKGCRLHNP